MSDEMIKNKTWQHEETGRITTCAIRPGNRWYEVGVAMDCEHEDLTGKTFADKQDSRLRKDEFMQELDGRAEDRRPISRLRRDARATVVDLIECCCAWEKDARILGNVRAGDAAKALQNLLESAEEQSHRVMMVQNKKLYADAMEFGRRALFLSNENEKLRAFAQAIMESWPEGGIEGDDLQEIALKHGMLAPEIRHEPCGEWCQCNGIGGYDSDGWQRGVTCYRRTALLTGES